MALNIQALKDVQNERMALAARKNSDYGHGGIDTIAVGGLEGLATRLMDKAGRLLSLTRPGYEAKVVDESIRDTLIDMANYSEYGVLLVDGKWNPSFMSLAAMIAAHVEDSDARNSMLEHLKALK